MKKIYTILVAVLLSMSFTQAQTWQEVAKSLPTPYAQGLTNQQFGKSVSVDGDYAVIGSPNYIGAKGKATVLFFDGTNWEIQAELTASDGDATDYFGQSVSISGDNIVVGSWGDDDNGSNSGAAYVFTKPGADWITATETAKLTASDAGANDYFGKPVSIYGDNIVVGAYGDDDNGSNSGSAYVFTKPTLGWVTTSTETAKLTASDGAGSDYFGWSVSLSADNIVVGSWGDDDNGNSSGSAYVFTKPGADWVTATETAKLTASDGALADEFGKSVSIYGDNIVVGAYADDDNGSNSGSAYVFTKPGADWITATETAKLTASDGTSSDFFAYSVSISGDNIVAGAYQDYGNEISSGSAYVFTKPGADWITATETAKLTASDGAGYDYFGSSVSISGDNILVGAYQDDDNGTNSGSVYTFNKPVSGWATGNETEIILAVSNTITNINDNFGYSIAIDGNYAVIGTPNYDENIGLAYVLFFDGSTWIKQAELSPSDGTLGDYFGWSVSLSGDNIIVGAYQNTSNTYHSGSAYVFTKTGVDWADATETAKLTASDGAGSDYFGWSVSISGENIVVGAYSDDDNGLDIGSAYVFTKPVSGWVTTIETAKLSASDGASSDYFGWSVSISGDNIVIGSYFDDDNGTNSGSAYVFTKPVSGWVTATETTKLTVSDGIAQDNFGKSVSISGDNIVVGASRYENYTGIAYVFTKPALGWEPTATETAKLTASDGADSDYFGSSVSISGDNIVVGAYNDDDNGSNSGSAYVFTKPGADWITTTETAKLTASDGVVGDEFGTSVSISGDNIVVGAYKDDDNGTDAGSSYLFNYNCTETSSLDVDICYNSSYTYADGTEHTNIILDETYTSTLVGQASNGCDSVVTENITVLPLANNTVDVDVCYNSSFTYADGTEHTNIILDETYISTLVGQASNGCDSIVTENITVLPAIDVSVTENGASLSANAVGVDYLWIDCDNSNAIIVGEVAQVFTATTSGNYAVIITNNTCTDTSICNSITITDISENLNNMVIDVYPNPAHNQLIINNTQLLINNAEILDITGKTVKKFTVSNKIVSVDISNLRNGVYFLTLQGVNISKTLKVIKK